MSLRRIIAGWCLAACALMPAFASAVEPSPVEATGVIDADAGIDASNWDVAPFNAQTFTQTDRIFPTLLISPGNGPVASLPRAAAEFDLNALELSDPATGNAVSATWLLEKRMHNSGLILLYRGQVIHESYRNGLNGNTRHIAMSASGSLIGMLAQIAVQEGALDVTLRVSRYVPEVRDKEAWDDITVRHVLDMRDGMQFVEDYDDPDSDVRRQDRAIGWRPRLDDDPRGLRDFVQQNLNEKAYAAGRVFNYASIQTDILGMAIEGATRQPLEVFFENEFWSRIGAESPAGMGTDGFGQPIVQGAISMTLPDFARVAMLILNQGQTHSGEQLISRIFFRDLLAPNRELADAFAYFDPATTYAHYRSQFWVNDTRGQQFLMNGVHGQMAFFDYKRDFAFVAFGNYPDAVSSLLSASQFSLIEAILTELDRRRSK